MMVTPQCASIFLLTREIGHGQFEAARAVGAASF
jgi:hypothetical protein